ncbi:MAG: DUF389 domain-containing protein, partial [Anaerolineales bacterium]|nr:DUF389 domain-containing protein [Anaerolineales bacterium]
MKIPPTQQMPDDPERMPPARRRRAGRLLLPFDAEERETILDTVAQRASLSFDFFLFSFLSGLGLAIGLVLDSSILLVAGALLAPLMVPAVGLALGTVTGSIRHFGRSLLGLLIGSLLVFGCGWGAGLVAYFLNLDPPNQAYLHARLSG